MIDKFKVIAIIPARCGSKGVTNKNLRIINKKPLIFYTIQAALGCKYIDCLVVSTDSSKIANISKKFGALVPFLRPSSLAQDNSKTIDSIIFTIDHLKSRFDIVIVLQPTSPLRNSNNIKESLEIFAKNKKSLASVSRIDLNPYLIRTIDSKNHLRPILNSKSTIRRQDIGEYYKVNGAIYINFINRLSLETSFNDNEIAYIMEEKSSIDIDTKNDLTKARKLLKVKKE